MIVNEVEACRLCDGDVNYMFEHQILLKYNIKYYECKNCGSLQTEEPYWLDESYSDDRRVLDVGGVMRVEKLRLITLLVHRVLRINSDAKLLDWGAGDGLFVRMLRDDGVDASHWDTYSENIYAAGFERNQDLDYDFITSFEVFEHLPYPKQEMQKIFAGLPSYLLITTGLYAKQGPTWDYLNLLTGRHVFFYSRHALALIAKKYNYEVEIFQGFILYVRKPLSPLEKSLIGLFSRYVGKRRISGILRLLIPSRSLVKSDGLYVRSAVERGELWPKKEQ